jgi:hypothetical protein
MAKFEVEVNGKRFEVEAPDQATAISAARSMAPPAARAPITADTLMDLAREQFTPDPALAPQVVGNPQASSLPGPLGQFQNSSRAIQSGFIEGLTGNLSNELASGIIAPFDALGTAAQGGGFDVGRSFNNLYQSGQEQAQGQAALNPTLNNQGNLAGALYLGSKVPSLMSRASTPLGMAGAGAMEGAAYGGIYGAGGAEGGDRLMAGLQGAGTGTLVGGVVGSGASMFQQPVSQESRMIAKGLQADQIDPTSVAARMAALGPDGIVADLGPNLQGQAAAIATLPGSGSRKIIDALTGRRAGANARIKQGVDDAIGPAPRVSEIQKDLDIERKVVNRDYDPVFSAKALSDDPFMSAEPIITAIDDVIPKVVGETRAGVEKARKWLIDPETGGPTMDPQTIMAVRHELDGIIGKETNSRTAGVLTDLRKAIDRDLAAAVPGLKEVDADFMEVAKQGDALTRGSQVLDDGKTALSPADLVEEMVSMSPGQSTRLSQGTRAEIDRIIGTKANDRVALRNIVRGEGSWNADKLRAVFGPQRTDELLKIIDRESQFAELENLATSGSRTQVLKAAQDEVKGKVGDPSIIREALNFQYGNAAGKMADKVLGGAIAARRAKVVDRVADALIGKRLSPQMEKEIGRLIDGMPAKDKAIISALISGGASQ